MKILDCIFACRPMLHLPVWSIYLVSLHYHHQLTGASFSYVDLLVLAGLTMIIAGAYYINQVYDFQTDLMNKKMGFLQRGLVSNGVMMSLFLVLSVVPIALAAFYSMVTFFIYLQLLILSFVYSAPPLRLKDRPVSGLISSSYAFGFLMPLAVMPQINQHNAGLLGWDNPFYFFLAVLAIHILTTIPDVKGDRSVGKKTIGVVLPIPVALLVALLALCGASIVAYLSGYLLLMVISIVSFSLALVALVSGNSQIVLAAAKVPILLLTLLAGYFYPVYLLFVVAIIFATRTYYKRNFSLTYPRLA